MSRQKPTYAEGWKEFSRQIRYDRAKGQCECEGECGLHRTNPGPRRCVEIDGQAAVWAGGMVMRKAAAREGVARGANNPAWKGGRRLRKDGYVLIWTPEGDALEHRVVMEKHLGRRLTEDEIVHHKDGNRSNNAIENLEVISSQREHALKHGEENRGMLLRHGLKQCTLCFKVKELGDFYPTKHNAMGIQSWCKQCKNQRDGERRRSKRGR